MIGFYSNGSEQEEILFGAFTRGTAARGHACIRVGKDDPLCGLDAVVMFGVKSKDLWARTIAAGIVPVMLDKGYNRSRDRKMWRYTRISVGAHQPDLSGFKLKPDRIRSLPFPYICPVRKSGKHILLIGSSAKCHEFLDLPDPTEWATSVVAEIRKHTDRPIVYRPKQSWHDAVPIPGTTMSYDHAPIEKDIAKAWCSVTHSSGACVESVARGVPTLILGDAVTKPISSTDIAEIDDPECGDRHWLLANVAHFQYTVQEISDGFMWNILERYL